MSETNIKLSEDTKLKISIIGIGNAGNQVIEKAHSEKFDVFAINSSIKDLSDEVLNNGINSFIAGYEARGAGKNRARAKALFKSNGKTLFSVSSFKDMVEKSDVIFVVASTAGGTGSGIAPDLINLFSAIYPNKIIIFYGIIPKLTDSVMSQHNTIECLDEINKLNVPYMLADLQYYDNVANDIAYSGIAKHIIDSLNVIYGKYLHHSNNGMIDENDMKTIIGEPGYMSIYNLDNVTQDQADNKSIQSYIISLIKKSPAVTIQRDEIIREIGIIINCPDSMMEATKSGNYSELTNYVGVPRSIFENYATTNTTSGQFITILSGMNLPYNRVKACQDVITKYEEKLKKNKNIDLSDAVNKVSFLNDNDILPDKEIGDNEKKDLLDKFFN